MGMGRRIVRARLLCENDSKGTPRLWKSDGLPWGGGRKKIRDSMRRPMETLLAETPVKAALDRMQTLGLSSLPVQNQAGSFLGIVRAADLSCRVASAESEGVAPIKNCLASSAVTDTPIALLWLMSQGQDIVPIPETKRRSYFEENVSVQAIKLTAGYLRRIHEIAPKGATAGDRYADMRSINR